MLLRAHPLVLLAFACACGGTSAAEPPAARDADARRDTVVRAARVEPLETLYDSATLDVDGDGTAERIELGSNIPRDERYRDIHHRWSVIVRDGADSYPLLHEYISLAVGFWVIPGDSARPAAILVQASAVFGPTEGTRLEKFVYDRARGGYARTEVIDGWSGHAVYRGPQGFADDMPPTGRHRHDARAHEH